MILGVNSTMLPYQTDKTVVARQMKACGDRGIEWVRMSFQWHLIQPDKNIPANWTMVDYAVQQAAANGINILGIVGGCPLWANGGKALYPPTDLGAWAQYCATVFARYPQVKTWQLWNEENIRFWMPDPDPVAYVNLVKATATSKRVGDKFIMGGLAGAGAIATDYLESVLKLGITTYLDGIAYHPYAELLPTPWYVWNNHDPQEKIALDVLTKMKAQVARYTAKPLEWWLTELGWTTAGLFPWQTVSEQLQADYWVRTRQCYDGKVDALFWFDLWEAGDPAQWWGGAAWSVNHYGLLRYDFSRKPAFAQFH